MALHRPYIRSGVRAEVESNALKNENGQFLDANTGKPIEGKYDLGHKAGHEFRAEQAKAEKEGLTQAEFNERMNDPSLYQIESPSSNRSHQYEDHTPIDKNSVQTSLHRPYIRKDVRAAVEANALKNENGQFLDANTGKAIEGKYDLGHKAGHEFRTEQAKAEQEGLTQAQFNERMNNPALYQIEDPSSNRSHQFEDKGENIHMSKSCAEDAYGWQGVKKDDNGIVTDDSFPGHDNYQNGVIEHGSDTTIYCTNWYDGQPGSGYFTDQGTVDQCTHGGVLNSNELGEALQTAPSNYGTGGGDYQHKPNCTAYDVDWDRLDALKSENPDLYGKLTNPDGASPDNDGIKCAYGRAEANPQYGNGGGNQYYIDKDTFNQAKDAGVFKENPDKSFSEDKGNLTRQDIKNDAAYENNLASQKEAVIAKEDAKQTPSADQMNSYQAKEDPSKPYIAKPDQAYGYDKSENTQKGTENVKDGKVQNNEKGANDIKAPPAEKTDSGKTDGGKTSGGKTDGGKTEDVKDNQHKPAGTEKTEVQKPSGKEEEQQKTQTPTDSKTTQNTDPTDGKTKGGKEENGSTPPPVAKSSEGHAPGGTTQNTEGSSGMSTKAATTDQTASGAGKTNPSGGMSTKAAGADKGTEQTQGASGGMSTTAAGKEGSAPSNSSGQSKNSGHSM